MKKVVVLLKKDGDDLKGEFLSSHNRLKYLKALMPDTIFHPYIIKEYDGFVRRVLKKTKVREKKDFFIHENISYNVIWVKSFFIDAVLNKLIGEKFFLYRNLDKIAKILPSSDIIIAHSFYPGYVANKIFRRRKIPFTITWHGSDIHSNPRKNCALKNKTAIIINNASVNYFVSENLLRNSDYITQNGNKIVLYNGVNNNVFYPLGEQEKSEIKLRYHIPTTINVAFIGNLYPIKNVMVLPEIFFILSNYFKQNIYFHIIGDGYLRNELENKFQNRSINVKFWGNVLPSAIPGIINVMNLVVLPSLNEGLPLVATESLACGTPLLGSDVGGIKEVVGDGYVIPLNNNFVQEFSKRAIDILLENPKVTLKKDFLWENSAIKERQTIEEIF